MKRVILFVAWGNEHLAHLSATVSKTGFPGYPIYLLTDNESKLDKPELFNKVLRIDFELNGLLRKTEMWNFFPKEDNTTFLFLDTDTVILGDISLGFEKAERFGMAIAQAAHYSMDQVLNFSEIMKKEGVESKGQLQYNSGVIFFRLNEKVRQVFERSYQLSMKHQNEFSGDQTFLSLAIEMLSFNPYTLSTGYNHRAFGELISGKVRIWHSKNAIPKNLNVLNPTFARKYEKGKIVRHFMKPHGFMQKLMWGIRSRFL
ncbi:MAG: lipopolysaccharide biosynthesis glycosyltransferase [Roseivirga sp.]|jgi:lipopolysaccharide biosynthesis glycosyltransferase